MLVRRGELDSAPERPASKTRTLTPKCFFHILRFEFGKAHRASERDRTAPKIAPPFTYSYALGLPATQPKTARQPRPRSVTAANPALPLMSTYFRDPTQILTEKDMGTPFISHIQ